MLDWLYFLEMKEENQEGLYTRVINIDEGRGAALNRSLNNLENKTPSLLQLPEGSLALSPGSLR